MVKITGRIKKYGNSYYFGIPKAFIDQELISERELVTCEITTKIVQKEEIKDEPADFRTGTESGKNSLFKNLTTSFTLGSGLMLG